VILNKVRHVRLPTIDGANGCFEVTCVDLKFVMEWAINTVEMGVVK
jgi:hypothetical protein